MKKGSNSRKKRVEELEEELSGAFSEAFSEDQSAFDASDSPFLNKKLFEAIVSSSKPGYTKKPEVQKTQEEKVRSMAEEGDRKLFLEMPYPDVHFQVNQQLMPAHRYILLTRCPAFGRMFTSGMMESTSSVIQINDIKAETFRAFLEFIYCAEVTIPDIETSIELLREADKYSLPKLKKKVGRYLQHQINKENVIRLANLSELHEIDSVKEAALDYIFFNFDALFEDSQNKLTDLLDPLIVELFFMKFHGFWRFKHENRFLN